MRSVGCVPQIRRRSRYAREMSAVGSAASAWARRRSNRSKMAAPVARRPKSSKAGCLPTALAALLNRSVLQGALSLTLGAFIISLFTFVP